MVGARFSDETYETGPSSLLKDPNGAYAQGVIVEVSIRSRAANVSTQPAMVYEPTQYFTDTPDTRFPVASLLPGSPGSPSDSLIGAHNADEGQTFVLIRPSVSANRIADTECVNGSPGQWETYLTVEVPTWAAAIVRN